MKSVSRPQMVHESETQRQHVRLPFPALVEFNGREYQVKDLSSGGLSVKGIEGNFPDGSRLGLRLKLPFGSFSLDVNLEAEAQHYNESQKTLGCLFVNLDAEQISLLNYMLKAFIAGDVVSHGDVLNIAARDNFAKGRNKGGANATAPSLARQIPGLIAIAIIGLVIVAFIGSNLYNSLFLLKSTDAVVTGPADEIRATQAGNFTSQLDPEAAAVKKGQVIGSISGERGNTQITSPCDCFVKKIDEEGGFVTEGTALVSLTPVDSKPWVMAQIDPTQIGRLRKDTPAVITIFGSNAQFTGHIVSLESGMAAASNGDAAGLASQQAAGMPLPAVMKIQADQKIPVDLVNRPASVSFSLMQ